MKKLNALWAYRGFIAESVKRDFQLKYRNSILGFAWAIINPLAMIGIYTAIFSQVMKAKMPGIESDFAYSVYLCSGIITWGLFSEIIQRELNVFIDNANLIKKMNFPRICLPVVGFISPCANFLIVFLVFLSVLVFTGSWPGVVFLAVFPFLFVQILLAVGLGVSLGVINVFFRDVGQLMVVFLQFWFWATPIVYLEDILPYSLLNLFELNPVYPLVRGYHKIFVEGTWPQWDSLYYPMVLGLIMCGIGLFLFRKNVGNMVDEL